MSDGAEYRKECLANTVLIVDLSSSGTSDERRECAIWHSLMCRVRYAGSLRAMDLVSHHSQLVVSSVMNWQRVQLAQSLL